MDGCLFRNIITNNYYLVNSIASYNILATEFGTFKGCFIQKDNLDEYELIDYSVDNIKELLNNYDEFIDNIDYNDLNDFKYLNYNNRTYFIRNWRDIYNFVANRI
jgi:hypothetical protein